VDRITVECDGRHILLFAFEGSCAQHMEVLAMKTKADFVQSERRVSELATLSRDPALTFRPDPAFLAKFRNPDEIIEGDFNGIEASTRPPFATPQPWACATSLRRSPKD
jgi:hypothetical protein